MQTHTLRPGDTIGIVSPSHVATVERYAPILDGLARAGYRVKTGRNLYRATYGYSATEAERAEDFNAMVLDDEVKLVFFGGGEGAIEVVPLIDFAAVAAHPKLYLSYSDGTDILNAIYLKTGLVTYYGQMPGLFPDISPYNLEQFMAHIVRGNADRHISDSPWRTIHPGTAEGTLIGGYLGNIALLLGSNAFPWKKSEPYILFLEDHESFYSLDRLSALLSHVEQSAFMERVTGLIFGHYSESTPPALYERLARLGRAHGIPVMHTDDFGHGANHAILPIGRRARLDTEKGLFYQE